MERAEIGILLAHIYGKVESEAFKEIANGRIHPERLRQMLAALPQGDQADLDAVLAARRRLQEARTILAGDDVALGAAFVGAAAENDTLTKLARYATSIERSMSRALEELRRSQALRRQRDASTSIGVRGRLGIEMEREQAADWPTVAPTLPAPGFPSAAHNDQGGRRRTRLGAFPLARRRAGRGVRGVCRTAPR
jgi:hypothetical protein